MANDKGFSMTPPTSVIIATMYKKAILTPIIVGTKNNTVISWEIIFHASFSLS